MSRKTRAYRDRSMTRPPSVELAAETEWPPPLTTSSTLWPLAQARAVLMSASSAGKATAPAWRTEDLKKRSMAEGYSGCWSDGEGQRQRQSEDADESREGFGLD